jgi:hypothetical protein
MSEARAGRPLASVQLYDAVDELRQAVAGFVDLYNSSWLIQGTATTANEAYQASTIGISTMTG